MTGQHTVRLRVDACHCPADPELHSLPRGAEPDFEPAGGCKWRQVCCCPLVTAGAELPHGMSHAMQPQQGPAFQDMLNAAILTLRMWPMQHAGARTPGQHVMHNPETHCTAFLCGLQPCAPAWQVLQRQQQHAGAPVQGEADWSGGWCGPQVSGTGSLSGTAR